MAKRQQSMMVAYFIDSADTARYTGCGFIGESNGDTWARFQSLKPLDVDAKTMDFMIDYYNAKGDLADTVGLTAADYARVTGAPVLTEAEYVAYDNAYHGDLNALPAPPEGER